MELVFTSIDEVAAIPAKDLPLMVLSSNQRSFLSYAICARTSGQYNHFMWMIQPGQFATQDWWYRQVPVRNLQKLASEILEQPALDRGAAPHLVGADRT